jgi:hypothetical protein
MHFRALPLLLFASVTTLLAQTPQANRAVDGKAGTAAAPAGQPDANGVDTIISLVKANMSEALVLKTIQRQNKAYDLTPQDLVKLQQAGASETIINAMLDPSSATAAKPAPAAVPPPAAAPAAPVAPAAPAASATASKNASSSPAAGCPQPSSTAAPAASQQEAKGGMFSSFKNKLKTSAEKTVDGLGDTLNCAADKGVQGSQTQVSSALDSAVAVPAQKVSDVGSTVNSTTANATGNKPATTAGNKPATTTASTTASATPAPAAGKRSAK